MKRVTATAAVRAIPDGSNVILPGIAAHPASFYQAFSAGVERFQRLTLCSGMLFGGYEFLEKGLGEHFRYKTWQASPGLRSWLRGKGAGSIDYVPLRLGELHRVVCRGGILPPKVLILQTSVPAADGSVSLGISVGPNPAFIGEADLIIAEMNPSMPVTAGAARVPADRIHLAFESDAPLCEVSRGMPEAREETIIDHVLDLIPDGATVQLGVGAVPDQVLSRLHQKRDIHLFSGLLTGGVMEFLDKASHQPRITAGELAGNQGFYDFCGRTPLIEMAPTTVTHNVLRIAAQPGFVSINSSIEVDLQGQSNGEMIGTTQISGVGGSQDYVEGACWSPGGRSIIAMPSTTADGRHSRIVPALTAGAAVTTPRYCTDYVVTEYGVAALKGRDLSARAEALIAIAHPEFRAGLQAALTGG